MADVILSPGGFVPQQAIAFGDAQAAATAVSRLAGLPVESAAPGAAVVTIAAAAALSPAVDLDRQRLHRIAVPAGWTAAAISFQVSADGGNYADLWDRDGEVTLAAGVAAAGRAVLVDPAAFFGIRYVKLRSGTAAAPVTQGADRALTLVTVAR